MLSFNASRKQPFEKYNNVAYNRPFSGTPHWREFRVPGYPFLYVIMQLSLILTLHFHAHVMEFLTSMLLTKFCA